MLSSQLLPLKLSCFILLLFACRSDGTSSSDKNKELDLMEATQLENDLLYEEASLWTFEEYYRSTYAKELPLLENTSFDSFIDPDDIENIDARILSLDKIYPDFFKNKMRALSMYRLMLSPNYASLVVCVRKNQNEQESLLINYTLDGEIIDWELVAYDEIAESMSRVEAKINEFILKVNHASWWNNLEVSQEIFSFDADGKIEKIRSINLNKEIENFYAVVDVMDQLDLHLLDVKPELITSKELNKANDTLIVVIPELVYEDEFMFDLSAHIVLVHPHSGVISHKYFAETDICEWISDAIELRKITIDTAPYTLNEKETAFGIRTSFVGQSRVNPINNEILSLFRKKGNKLEKILDHLDSKYFSGNIDAECEEEYYEEKRILQMQEDKSYGLRDILVKTSITESSVFLIENGECVTEERVSTTEDFLKFDGQEYVWEQ
ncbi:MAG: hypothetical protein KDC82_04645 [Bacteroidetes bacterium]|nr:hypothetical protein [Bacteroidota bacterium]